jgi:phage shock protein A
MPQVDTDIAGKGHFRMETEGGYIMGILTRIVRICKADIHGVMDQLEDQGLLLKQHLRDMEKALSHKENRLNRLAASRQQMKENLNRYQEEMKKIEQDLTVSIEKGRDDIARMLIKKLKPMALHKDELRHHIEIVEQEIARTQEIVEVQRRQYEQVQLKSKAFDHKKGQQEWERRMSSIVQKHNSQNISDEEIELELIRRKEALASP